MLLQCLDCVLLNTTLIVGYLVTLVVTFDFFAPKLGGGGDQQMVLCDSMNADSVVETLKLYRMKKNLFELFCAH